MTELLTLPETSLLELPEETTEKIRQCSRVLLFGRAHNLHKVGFVSSDLEILHVLLKEEPDQPLSFSSPEPDYVAFSAKSPHSSLVTRSQARHLLGECSYYLTGYPNSEVFNTVLRWLA